MKKYEMKISNFTVRFEPAAGGGYDGIVPTLPDIKVHGKTLKEARVLAKEAVERYIDALKSNEPFPDITGRLIDEVQAYMARNSQIGRP
jgi:predicted RNase H-like HicB family nuclease